MPSAAAASSPSKQRYLQALIRASFTLSAALFTLPIKALNFPGVRVQLPMLQY